MNRILVSYSLPVKACSVDISFCRQDSAAHQKKTFPLLDALFDLRYIPLALFVFTGFVCYYRGWQDFRDDNFGVLWEHFVLNEIAARLQSRGVFCW
jgi:hypothetical protein